ncbi:hypothetical protein [Caulobacter sp. RHG1]|uniref:hypothetical protein n=1 Tax=Caulobacter sp. (strain RHG1) TaxID=2545762 RepID=UPI001556D3A0|nr:hypothetical protein [Caulobacter sp. RHG1]NQE62962.1 hypothetical protein [Caulobacter sp. RHG1]
MPGYGTDEEFSAFLNQGADRAKDSGDDVFAELLKEIRSLRRELRSLVENCGALAA